MKSLYQPGIQTMPNHSKKIFFILLAGALAVSLYFTIHQQQSVLSEYIFPDEAPDFNAYITMHDDHTSISPVSRVSSEAAIS